MREKTQSWTTPPPARGARPGSQTDEAFANLSTMTIGGGASPSQIGIISTYESTGRSWQAENDGFFQLQATCATAGNGEVQLELLDESDNRILEVTPKGKVGRKTGEERRLLWTVPVRKNQKVRLTLYSTGGGYFELASVKAQFVYFGVTE